MIKFVVFVTLCGASVTALLVFPPTAPTRTQLIVGIGIPFDTDEAVSVISGWVLKSQHLLPINSTDLHPVYFPDVFGDNGIGPLFSFGRKRREIVEDQATGQHYERYDGTDDLEVVEVKSDAEEDSFDDGGHNYRYDEEEDLVAQLPSEANEQSTYNPDDLRWMMYRNLEAIAKSKGFEGKVCVMRAICEAAETPFTQDNGLFGEITHILLTPSSTSDQLSQHADNEYLHAEQVGKSGQPCDQVFRDCSESILDIFSGVYDPIEEFVKMMG